MYLLDFHFDPKTNLVEFILASHISYFLQIDSKKYPETNICKLYASDNSIGHVNVWIIEILDDCNNDATAIYNFIKAHNPNLLKI